MKKALILIIFALGLSACSIPFIGQKRAALQIDASPTSTVYLNDSDENVFIHCTSENQSPSTGDALTINASHANTFIGGFFSSDEGGIVFTGSHDNTFMDMKFDSDPANTANYITFDATSYNNHFYGIWVVNYDYDDFVSDSNSTSGPNLFHNTRSLAGGSLSYATSGWTGWSSSNQPPDKINFNTGRKVTVFGDIYRYGRSLIHGVAFSNITSLTSNTLDVSHLEVKKIVLGGADNLSTISNGLPGQIITLIFGNSNCTIVDGAALNLSGGGNWNPGADDVIQLVCIDGTTWYEVSRSAN